MSRFEPLPRRGKGKDDAMRRAGETLRLYQTKVILVGAGAERKDNNNLDRMV